MKILLAVDPPEQSDAAINAVAGRPWPPSTIVEVLSVVEPSYVLDVPTLVEGLQEAAELTRFLLGSVAAAVARRSVISLRRRL